MIGSSLDGIDVIDCTLSIGHQNAYHIHSYREFPLSQEIKEGIRSYEELDTGALSDLGLLIAREVGGYIEEEYGSIISQIDIIGFHGITLIHLPSKNISLQLGCGQTLASVIGKPVVTNFRNEDLEAGGVGTPMAPLVESYFFPEFEYFLNLGGIANISIHNSIDISAFDVCPFNQALNYFSLKESLPFDKSGQLAESGKVDDFLLRRLSSITFFHKKPPKSLDNNWIKERFIPFVERFKLTNRDTLATLISFFANEISKWVKSSELPIDMMVTGGGAKNLFFIDCLKERLKEKNVSLVIPESRIVDGKEALLIALAAVLRKEEKPNFISSVTGAKENVSGGTIFYP